MKHGFWASHPAILMTLSHQVGKYTLLGKIADGGMAEVFLAVTGGLGGFQKRVALKLILPHFTRDDSFVRSFVNEARICGQLQHPNLVQVYEFQQIDDRYYLAMEFIEGLDLERIITDRYKRRRPIPLPVSVEIVVQMLEGLEYAHSATGLNNEALRVIHRDLKPSNILIDRGGVIKIVDFGVAKATTNLYKTMNIGTAKGTVSYMSPEQAAGKTNLGPASDLFGVGCILYELLTLERLFDGSNLFQILDEVRTAELGPRLARLPTIPEPLYAVLAKALERDLSTRYTDATAMLRDLRGIFPKEQGPSLLARFVRDMESEGIEIIGPANIIPLSETGIAEDGVFSDRDGRDSRNLASSSWKAEDLKGGVDETEMEKTEMTRMDGLPDMKGLRYTPSERTVREAFKRVPLAVPEADTSKEGGDAADAPPALPVPPEASSRPKPSSIGLRASECPATPTPRSLLHSTPFIPLHSGSASPDETTRIRPAMPRGEMSSGADHAGTPPPDCVPPQAVLDQDAGDSGSVDSVEVTPVIPRPDALPPEEEKRASSDSSSVRLSPFAPSDYRAPASYSMAPTGLIEPPEAIRERRRAVQDIVRIHHGRTKPLRAPDKSEGRLRPELSEEAVREDPALTPPAGSSTSSAPRGLDHRSAVGTVPASVPSASSSSPSGIEAQRAGGGLSPRAAHEADTFDALSQINDFGETAKLPVLDEGPALGASLPDSATERLVRVEAPAPRRESVPRQASASPPSGQSRARSIREEARPPSWEPSHQEPPPAPVDASTDAPRPFGKRLDPVVVEQNEHSATPRARVGWGRRLARWLALGVLAWTGLILLGSPTALDHVKGLYHTIAPHPVEVTLTLLHLPQAAAVEFQGAPTPSQVDATGRVFSVRLTKPTRWILLVYPKHRSGRDAMKYRLDVRPDDRKTWTVDIRTLDRMP